ncbi:MAG: hypothetical protein IPL87_02540 [Candidatus Moraniibacteriota bacterium]|nr:MAG: hypothetical protein IPL87_02540 [Candidatus Moranbacteria bacterium]
MNRTILALLLLGIFSFFPSPLFAAPAISSLSGTVSQGSSVMVSGSAFGTNSAIQEWIGSNIENGADGSAFSKSSWSAGQWAPVSYSTEQARSGSKSIKTTVVPGFDYRNGLFTHTLQTPIGSSEKLYVSWWVRPSTGAGTGQWKMLRVSGTETIIDGPQELVLFNWNNASNSQRVIDPGTSNDQTYWSNEGFPKANSLWQRVELVVNTSGIDQSNGSNTLGLYDGSSFVSNTWNSTRNFTASGQEYNYLLFQNYMGNGASGNIDFWFDDIFIQNGVARVELCDSPTWSTRGECDVQPRTAWSDTSISITLNAGGFSAGQTAYLYVIDASGTPNASGYPVTIGASSSDTTPPVRSNPAPSGSLTAGTTSTTMTLTTNETATCKYGTTDQAYASLPNTFTTTNSTSHSQTISGLSNGQSYTYHIRCQDKAGNANTTDFTVSFSVLSSTPTFSPCSTLTPSSSLPGGYGSPFDLFLSNTPLVAAECTASDIHTLKATIGIPGNQTRVSYTKGYWYNPGTSSWVEYTGACSGTQNGNWCQGPVTATVTHANIDTTSAQTPVTFVGMTCSVQNGAWKCGCRDTSCSSFLWQVQGAGR